MRKDALLYFMALTVVWVIFIISLTVYFSNPPNGGNVHNEDIRPLSETLGGKLVRASTSGARNKDGKDRLDVKTSDVVKPKKGESTLPAHVSSPPNKGKVHDGDVEPLNKKLGKLNSDIKAKDIEDKLDTKTSTSGEMKGESTPNSKYSPICDRWYNTSDSVYLDIVPKRAYYDNRTVSGEPRNLVVLLTVMVDSAVAERSVMSCELNGYYSQVNVIREATWWVRKKHPGYTHCNSFIHCIGFPKAAVRGGSTVKLIYRKKEDACYSRVATEKPLFIMKTGLNTLSKGSVVVCTALFGHPPYFNEWLKYQKAIGVDRVHLNVEASFAQNATHANPFLREALSTGFASMEVWDNHVGDRIYYYMQVTKYQDCVMRYTGVYEYAVICDPDDFFNPMVSGAKNIHFYLGKLFSNKKYSFVQLHWKGYDCEPVKSVYASLPDGNITKTLDEKHTTWSSDLKTIHKLVATDIVGVHTIFKKFPNYKSKTAERNFVYMAHIRPRQKC